jgi:hypothetical protein
MGGFDRIQPYTPYLIVTRGKLVASNPNRRRCNTRHDRSSRQQRRQTHGTRPSRVYNYIATIMNYCGRHQLLLLWLLLLSWLLLLLLLLYGIVIVIHNTRRFSDGCRDDLLRTMRAQGKRVERRVNFIRERQLGISI